MGSRKIGEAVLAVMVTGSGVGPSVLAGDAELRSGATIILQGSSGAETVSPEGDVADASMSFDLEVTGSVGEGGSVFAHFEAGVGEGVDGEIATLSVFNDDADDEADVRLTELWYGHGSPGEGPALRIGMMDFSADFDANAVANSETDQFLSAGFVNGLAIEFPDDNGFGLMMWISAGGLLDVGFGFADADADWEDVFDRPFAILELDFRPKPGERRGNYRVYGWLNGTDHADLTDPTRTGEKGYGFGISFDQEVSDTVSVFVRYAWERESVYAVEKAWSLGLQFSGKRRGEVNDVFGLAYGVAVIGDAWRSASAANDGDEQHLEIYCRFRVNDRLHVSPDVQWVRNAGGDADSGDVWALAIRAQLSF